MTIGLQASSPAQLKHQFSHDLNLSEQSSSKIINHSSNMDLDRDLSKRSDHKQTTRSHNNIKIENSIKRIDKNSFKYLFYCYLLVIIKNVLLIGESVKLMFMQFFYFILIKLHSIKFQLNDEDDHKKVAYDCNNPLTQLVAPNHVCVILNEPNVDNQVVYQTFHLIAEFMSNCKVDCLSFYQFNGVSNEIRDRLIEEFQKDKNNNCSFTDKNSLSMDSIAQIKQRIKKSQQQQQHLVENKSDMETLSLNFLSYEKAGRTLLSNACKTISNKIKNNQLNINNLSQDLIDTQILETVDLSEPQMIINIGRNDTLAGFSPWHSRLSEIMRVPSCRLVNQITLTNMLLKYNNIEKRFGK